MASTVYVILTLAIVASLVDCHALRKRHSSVPEDELKEAVIPKSLSKLVSWHGTCSEDLELVVPLAHNPWYNIVKSHNLGSCPVRLQENHQINRVPAYIMTATCAPGCEHKRCSLLGDFKCQEVKAKVIVKYIREDGEQSYKFEKFPVGCVCASKSGIEIDLADRSL